MTLTEIGPSNRVNLGKAVQLPHWRIVLVRVYLREKDYIRSRVQSSQTRGIQSLLVLRAYTTPTPCITAAQFYA